jgi:hypothetical protein
VTLSDVRRDVAGLRARHGLRRRGTHTRPWPSSLAMLKLGRILS